MFSATFFSPEIAGIKNAPSSPVCISIFHVSYTIHALKEEAKKTNKAFKKEMEEEEKEKKQQISLP